MVEVAKHERQLVAKAKRLQATGNVTSWELADIYAALRCAGWKVRKIADECETNRQTVSRFCVIVSYYCDIQTRPSFWDAFQNISKLVRSREQEQRDAIRAAAIADQVIADEVRLGDFREVLADLPDGSADLIFTDPPYDRESLPLYADLGTFAARVLCDGGSLITYFGQALLPEVVQSLADAGLTYRWMVCVAHEAGGPMVKLRTPQVFVMQKPLLWFSKGVPFQAGPVGDLIQSVTPDKDAHDWQQSGVEAAYLIDRLTQPGGFVVDPFAGSGTTLRAAKGLGRRYLGAEVDEVHCRTASRMLVEEGV